MVQQHSQLRAVGDCGCDGLALKPTATSIERLVETTVPVDQLVIDYEGRSHVPTPELCRRLAETYTVRVTTPVRADGFDPLGDDSVTRSLPAAVGRVIVAGHPAYLDATERNRAIATRLGAAFDRAPTSHQPWVGTESIERIAMAVGGVQYELLSGSTLRTVSALRSAGYDSPIAVYAPTVLSEDSDLILDALGEYVARRRSVRDSLEALGRQYATDSSATGEARSLLLGAVEQFGIVGDRRTVTERIDRLRSAGVTTVICHPAAAGNG